MPVRLNSYSITEMLHLRQWFSCQNLEKWCVLLNPLRLAAAMMADWGMPLNRAHGELLTYRNRHKDGIGFLIGNGPSVRIEDLNQITGCPTFCCNRFYLAYPMMKFRPDYLISGDKQMIADFGREMLQKADCSVWFCSFKNPRLDGNYSWVRSFGRRKFRFRDNLCDHIEPGGATLVAAVQIGYWMGIRRFFLYGVDHSFTFQNVPKTKNVYQSAKGDGNHFIKNYRSGKPWCPPTKEDIEKGFRGSDAFLRSRGGWIKNATRGGELEVLERVSFEAALEVSK